jgi:Trk K+ transport system NAD-binding subunit
MTSANRSRWRKLRASGRDTALLLREFRQPLLVFILVLVGFGILYDRLSLLAGHEPRSYLYAVYQVLVLAFLQPIDPFPEVWYLQIFYFVMPVVGIGILAQGLAEFGVMFFNRSTRNQEWEAAVASTLKNHVVLVGLGHLGFRVVKNLHEMEKDVCVVTINPESHLARRIQAWDIPLIEGDGAREDILLDANIREAHSIILCTQDDNLNLRIALKARSLNPKLEIVVRIFDDDFADELKLQFGFQALSATGMAAPVFAAMAADVEITPPINIEGQANSLARMTIQPGSALRGMTINAIEDTHEVSIVLIHQDGARDFHPVGTRCVEFGDTLGVLGTPEHLNRLVHQNGN